MLGLSCFGVDLVEEADCFCCLEVVGGSRPPVLAGFFGGEVSAIVGVVRP